MKTQTYKNRCYISQPATTGAVVNVGEITTVYYLQHEVDSYGRALFYATDGWKIEILGSAPPGALLVIARLLLGRELGNAAIAKEALSQAAQWKKQPNSLNHDDSCLSERKLKVF